MAGSERDDSLTAPALAKAALGGAVAAMAMTGMRRVTTQLGLVGQVPPEAILTQRAHRAMRELHRPERIVAIELAHWGYGAFAGALFRALPRRWRARAWAGPAYGLALWGVLEAVLEPALGLKQARRARPVERLVFAVDHVLYGLVLGGSDWAQASPAALPGPGPDPLDERSGSLVP